MLSRPTNPSWQYDFARLCEPSVGKIIAAEVRSRGFVNPFEEWLVTPRRAAAAEASIERLEKSEAAVRTRALRAEEEVRGLRKQLRVLRLLLLASVAAQVATFGAARAAAAVAAAAALTRRRRK